MILDPTHDRLAVEHPRMRKIDTRDFHLATRSTPREVNRQIVLNLIRELQPISRAELARRMAVRRSTLTPLVRELLAGGAVVETGTARSARGRRPTLLRVRASGRRVLAVDVRGDRTYAAVAEFGGQLVARDSVPTPATPAELVEAVATLAARLGDEAGAVHAVGLVVPGMVDRRTGRLLYAPRLGWRDVELRDALAARLGLPVHVESAPIACALARLWGAPADGREGPQSFAYVSISDGVGVGLVHAGELLRGAAHTAGEFGHVTLDPAGPRCACGKRGCWEAMACNAATITRYVTRRAEAGGDEAGDAGAMPAAVPSVAEIIRRAQQGDVAAVAALGESGRQIGRGLAAVVSAFNPERIYVAGEITAGWSFVEPAIRAMLVAETLTAAARATPILPDGHPGEYRLLGAVALVGAPAFAAPAVA